MRRGDFRASGIDLAERVRSQVDARAELDRLRGTHRRRLAAWAVAGTVAAVIVVITTFVLARPAGRVADSPTTTATSQAPPSTNLPVGFAVALLDEFAVEGGDPVQCSGTGVHAGIGSGTVIGLVDEGIIETVAVNGTIIDPDRVRALGLPTADAACLFPLGEVSIDPDRLGMVQPNIDPYGWPPPGSFEAGSAQAGQQLTFYSRGLEP